MENGQSPVAPDLSNSLAHRSLVDAQVSKPLSPTEPKSPRAHKSSPSKSISLPEKKLETKRPKQAIPISAVDGQVHSNAPTSKTSSQSTLPDHIIHRNQLFDELKRRHDVEILEKEHHEINVTLDLGVDKDGKPRPLMPVAAKAWESTPGLFLRHVDKDISADVVIAKVDNKELWDLDRPLEYACQIRYIPFSSPEGRNVFWHSSAHVLGEAAECQYNCLLSHGPPTEQGFFYDMAIADK